MMRAFWNTIWEFLKRLKKVKKKKKKLLYDPEILLLGEIRTLKRIENIYPQENWYMYVHSGIIPKSWEVETTQMSINR